MSETRPDCPQCGGAWLYGLTHQHRVSCPRYRAESATIAADHQRGAGIRDITDTELHTAQEHNYEHTTGNDGYFIGFTHAGGLHHRELLIGDSDAEPGADGLYSWRSGFTPARRTADPGTGE